MKRFGPWEVECQLDDGARLSRLRYNGVDLLTTAPAAFRPPAKDHGRYETRPVYGYDDCFPTVDACDDWPDHGELCWLPWQGTAERCSVRSRRWPLTFVRSLEFDANRLTWSFAVQNEGASTLPFQHVMHPLMPLDQIADIELPAGKTVHDDLARRDVKLDDVGAFLLAQPQGAKQMLFLRSVNEGRLALRLRSGCRLTVRFPHGQFPTVGIWWNNASYPDENGLRRCECAFEPTPGGNSRLSDGTTLVVRPRSTLEWRVIWEMD